MRRFRTIGLWFLVGLLALAFISTLTGGSSAVTRPLTDFIEDIQAQRVTLVEVNGQNIRYRLVGDDRVFKARMEEQDTIREVLQGAGVQSEDFPPIKLTETSFWSTTLLFSVLLAMAVVAAVYFSFLRPGLGRGVTTEKNDDPVCGRSLHVRSTPLRSEFMDATYPFCSMDCKEQFDADPVNYVLKTQ